MSAAASSAMFMVYVLMRGAMRAQNDDADARGMLAARYASARADAEVVQCAAAMPVRSGDARVRHARCCCAAPCQAAAPRYITRQRAADVVMPRALLLMPAR